MRLDVSAPSYVMERKRAVTVTLYPLTVTPRQLLLGTAVGGTDVSLYVNTLVQNGAGVTIKMTIPSVMVTPVAGQCVSIKDGATTVVNTIVEKARSQNIRAGERTVTLTARSRDAFPLWRKVRRVSPCYEVGTDLGAMARDVALKAGLQSDEFYLPHSGVLTSQDLSQLADLTLWEMLTTILEPSLGEPYVDARGMLKSISRDLHREPDYIFDDWSPVLGMTSQIGFSPLTAVRVQFVDPELSKVTEEDQCLTTATNVCGFFKWKNSVGVWWSDDHSMRADSVRMVVKESINDGLLPVGSESFKVVSPYGGVVSCECGWYVPVLATASVAGYVSATLMQPSYVGRVAEGVALSAILMTMFRIAQGYYEIWGKPYDFVHAINEVEAYDEDAPAWLEKVETIKNALVPNEEAANTLAVGELLYRARSAQQASLSVMDDYRYERGDIIQLADGSHFYILEVSRDLTRGKEATAELTGFYA